MPLPKQGAPRLEAEPGGAGRTQIRILEPDRRIIIGKRQEERAGRHAEDGAGGAQNPSSETIVPGLEKASITRGTRPVPRTPYP